MVALIVGIRVGLQCRTVGHIQVASVGTMNSSTLPSSARWNAARSSDMKNNGPPRKMTVP